MADKFMEYLDKQDKEMKAILRGVEAQEQRRMDSLGTDKKDSN